MRIGETRGISIGMGGADSARSFRVEPVGDAPRAAGRPSEESRALVPVEQPAERENAEARLVRHRVYAPFLAQLLATREGMADTRSRRRAEPSRAARIYADAMAGESPLTPGWLVDAAL